MSFAFTTPAGHTNVNFVASSGDSGSYQPAWPSVSPNVVAVGGTTLTTTADGTYEGESAWSDSGGGVSRYDAEPIYQLAVQ